MFYGLRIVLTVISDDIKKISKYRRKVDLRFEIHPFSRQEVEQDPPQFFLKIKQDGLLIQS